VTPRNTTHVLGEDALELVATRFRLLGDPSRLRLLNLLMQGECSVQELVDASGFSQTNVSRHLGLLRRDGVVTRVRDGNRAVYTIADRSVEKLCTIVCGGLSDQLADDLEAIQSGNI
jgi:ArsR family transcriptional regulator